jgi:membrane-bound lytic murein transglycosylase B
MAVTGGDPAFYAWLQAFRSEAAAAGIRRQTLDLALKGLHPLPKVLSLDHHQPEATMTFEQYVSRVVNPTRVESGRNRLAENRGLLQEVSAHYGVQAEYIVALWGVETDFGAFTGDFSVVAALATLAFGSSRPDLFRTELLAALRILDKGQFRPEDLKGSWAGAMGQTQFMPSSYLTYAVDYAGKGRADIWRDRADVFASIANYLQRCGWDGGSGWGMEVVVPNSFDPGLIGTKKPKPVTDWAALGVRPRESSSLPSSGEAELIRPGGTSGPVLLTLGNFRVIMRWNHSTYFATSVGRLAERIAA